MVSKLKSLIHGQSRALIVDGRCRLYSEMKETPAQGGVLVVGRLPLIPLSGW